MVDTIVRSITRQRQDKRRFLRGGTNYAQTQILRGFNLEVEGRGNGRRDVGDEGQIQGSDLRVARAVESRAAPLEDRATDTETKLTQVEQNAQRLSGR